jgi:hypothetical protein
VGGGHSHGRRLVQRRGVAPRRRGDDGGAAVRLVGSGAASLIAWGVGRLAHAPVLAATGVLVIWPLAAALVTAAVLLVLVLSASD